MRLSRGVWFLLLNPDVTVREDFLDSVRALANRLDRDEPRTGIVGLGVRNGDGSRQPSTGPFPTLLGTLTRLLLPRAWRKCHLLFPSSSQEVPWPRAGACWWVGGGWADWGALARASFFYTKVLTCAGVA